MWTPKPRNWRQYSGWYKPPRSLNWTSYRLNGSAEEQYIAWLGDARGWTLRETKAYCDAMDRRTIISQVTAPIILPQEQMTFF